MNFPKYPYLPFGEPIPPPPADRGAVCLTIDRKWKPYLVGLLKTLLIDRTWETDELRATGEASLLLEEILLAKDCVIPPIGGECGDECMGCCIRVEDGKIQTLNCGVWETIPNGDIRAIVNGTSQPAAGTPQPVPGGCMDFAGTVQYGGRWLLPFAVNGGDVITVSRVEGATSDYTFTQLLWRCGDGNLFLGNVCIDGSSILDGAAPMPTAPQQALIGFDGTNYYDFSAAAGFVPVVVTIPDEIVNANFTFLVNDEVTFGSGNLSFGGNFCKASADVRRFKHTFDLRIGLGPVQLRTDGTAPLLQWVAGVGVTVHNPSGVSGQGVNQIGCVSPRTLHNAVVRVVATVATDPRGDHGICNIPHTPIFTTANTECHHDPSGPNLDFTAEMAFDMPIWLVNCDAEVAGDDSTIILVEVSADGEDPWA